jgi:predicted metalloprotease with PDZ domain
MRRALFLALLVSACTTVPEVAAPPPPADPYLAVILPAARDAAPEARAGVARERMRGWVWSLAAPPSAAEPQSAWLAEGLGDFLAVRARLRAGLATPDEAAAEFDAALKAHDAAPSTANAGRAMLLALKWDEDIRQKSSGSLDLDDMMKAAHDRRAQVPNETTGFVDRVMNAAWGSAQLNLRDDVARYVAGRARVAPPETMFGTCLVSSTVLTHGFDTGFDHQGLQAARTVRGVVRNGPAWMSGLRNGMKLESLSLVPGDTSREVVAVAVDARGRKRTIRYWPYADEDKEIRRIALREGLSAEQTAACGKAMAGL